MRKFSILTICMSGTASLAVLAGAAAPAWAQDRSSIQDTQADTSEMPGAIVVTARKRTETLQDVPETITAFSSEALQRGGISNVNDLGRQLPNVVLNRRGDNEPNVVIRGVGAFGNTQGVGFYIDDVRNVTDQSARLVDLERVEVLKGPQGTLYGGSSIGGAIKFVTKKPVYDTEGSFNVEAGEQNILNVAGSVNVPIVDGVAALRISAYADNNGGYIYNPYLDENPDESTERGVRAVLRVNPDDQTEVLANLRYSKTENGGNDYYPTDGPRDYSYEAPLSERNYNRKQIFGGILSIARDMDFATLTSLTSYTRRRNQILWDIDYTPVDGVTASQRDPRTTKVFTQELRLASNGDTPFNWLVGAYYSSVTNYDLIGQVDLFLDEPARGDPTVPDFFNTSTIQRNYSAFVNVGYETGGFEINLGARLDHSKFHGTDLNTGTSANNSDTVVLPKVSLAYHVPGGLLIYASASKGYEPGRLNTNGLVPFKRESSVNLELGTKGDLFGGLMQFDLAGFYIKYKDRQFESRVNIDGVIIEAITNIGTSESYGVEFGTTVRPARGLTLSANGGLLYSKWLNGTFFGEDISGNRTTNAPRFTGTASADYSMPISNSLKIGLRGELTHNSGFFWDVPNLATERAYDIAGFRIALGDINDRWELALRIDNAFDEVYNYEYQDQILGDRVNGVCDNCSDARIGQPRLVKGSFSYKF